MWYRLILKLRGKSTQNLMSTEDEYHFVLICSKYCALRNTYIPRYFIRNQGVHKFIELLNSLNTRTLNNLAIFTTKALKLRLETENGVFQ